MGHVATGLWSIALLACLLACDEAAFAKSPLPVDSCSMAITVPNDDTVYSNLARLQGLDIHLTCPVNTRKSNEAKVFVLNAKDTCASNTFFGYPIVSRHKLTEADAKRFYGKCSGVVQVGRHETAITQRATYTWISTLPTEVDRAREMHTLFEGIAGGLMASGLPIDGFFSVNNTLCFEIDAEYPKDPLTAIRSIGIAVPNSIRQQIHPSSSCWKLLHVRHVTD